MEFPFNCDRAVSSDKEGFAILDSDTLKKVKNVKQAVTLIDLLGQLSAKV